MVSGVELQDAIRTRRMVRTFDPDRPVPQEALDRILRNGTRAPSAGFSQGQAWLVLRGEELEKFWTYGLDAVSESVRSAPLVLVPFSCKRAYLDRYAEPDKGWTDRDEARWPVPFWHIDTGMAAMLQLLTAVKDAFGVPDDYEPIGAIAIGYDAEPEKRNLKAKRRPIDSMIHYGTWGDSPA
jgi:nitroreductase